MTREGSIAANIARLRLDRQLTQEELAAKAGLSRVALGKIERGTVVPRARTLAVLATALAVPVGDLVTPVRPLESVRFRARARVHAREQILAEVSKWLDAYAGLETDLGEARSFRFSSKRASHRRSGPTEAARTARSAVGLGPEEPVRDICGLLEENGVKLLLLETTRDSFFGLSVGARDGGPAVVVNTGTGFPWSDGSSLRLTSSAICCFIPRSTGAMPPSSPYARNAKPMHSPASS